MANKNVEKEILEKKAEQETGLITYKSVDYNQLNRLETVRADVYQDLNSLKNMGFECSNIFEAYKLWKKALNENYKTVLAFTSNTISCGLRDVIALLCKHKLVDFLITTGGGIEEDIWKSKYDAKVISRPQPDDHLYDKGLNRTQNTYFVNDGYVYLEAFLNSFFAENPDYKKTTPKLLIKKMSEYIRDPKSYLFWCNKNNIPVIAGGLEDCGIGDYLGIKNYNKEPNTDSCYVLNSAYNLTDYLKFLISDERKVNVIILGGGYAKHMAMNGCISINGADMAIYFNSDHFSTGSNAGAPPSEAVSWGKLSKEGLQNSVKIYGDFVLPFYLIASELIKEKQAKQFKFN